MIKPIAKVILAFNGNAKKSQIAAGFAWGILLGLIPTGNFFFIILFLVSFFFRHNHWTKIFAITILKLLSPLLIYGIDGFGGLILHIKVLEPFFTTLYNMPFIPFTGFNNTLVAGGLVLGVILFVPSFFLFWWLVTLYRNHLAEKIRNSKTLQSIAKSPLLKFIGKAFQNS
ncbi:MAG: TIGR03546 family protein [Treponema sp.]|nr:TIGR03546 family protein [Treponema sp.]